MMSSIDAACCAYLTVSHHTSTTLTRSDPISRDPVVSASDEDAARDSGGQQGARARARRRVASPRLTTIVPAAAFYVCARVSMRGCARAGMRAVYARALANASTPA
eukprot:6202357-Pleurochrysis_carterae.AAC.1